jgi:hypothetical protein
LFVRCHHLQDFDTIDSAKLQRRKAAMLSQRVVTTLQLVGAALGIPAAAAGSYSAYQSYFSSEATCQRLRTNIVAIMERRIDADAKRTLLRKDIVEFDKSCGNDDPDARTVFQAALQQMEPAAISPAARRDIDRATAQAAVPSQYRQTVGIFGMPGYGGSGWVALSRRQERSWVANFSGYEISETSLPPAGTVLTAQHRMPVWSEAQAGANDPAKLHSTLSAGACVRVLAARPGAGRLWAQVAPSPCS